MEEQLLEYVKRKEYRQALGLPLDMRETYELLAQGEYNRNYSFVHPVTGKKLLFRINFGSQMHLKDQIGYEYHALKLLEGSGRTPIPLYVDGSCNDFPCGVMVMEYLPGHALNYETELALAAECLADIHSMKMKPGNGLIEPKNPLKAILEECEDMFAVYTSSPLANGEKIKKIESMLKKGWKRVEDLAETPYKCCINTELNSTNFLINGKEEKNYLIDWEKPLYGDPAQDLGHFLAQTTTFWKTDCILTKKEMKKFLEEYLKYVQGRFDTSGLEERTKVYLPVTCLRGITWCAMAWIEYQEPGRELLNPSTFQKLGAYLDMEFLNRMDAFLDI